MRTEKTNNSIINNNNISTSNSSSKSEKVKVYVRVRPFNQDEIKRGGDSPFTSLDTKSSSLSIKKDSGTKNWTYDGLYDQSSTQEQIFLSSAKPVIDVNIKNFYNIN